MAKLWSKTNCQIEQSNSSISMGWIMLIFIGLVGSGVSVIEHERSKYST
ncbi:unnamed protein product [Arabidopsis halleri]